MTVIHQGDQFVWSFAVKRDGQLQTPDDLDGLEVIIAGIRKTYPEDIAFNADSQKFLFPLSQEETLKLSAETFSLLCRPKFKDNIIQGYKVAGTLKVIEMEGAKVI